MRKILALLAIVITLTGCQSTFDYSHRALPYKERKGIAKPNWFTRSFEHSLYFVGDHIYGRDPQLRLDDRPATVIALDELWQFTLRHFFNHDKTDPFVDSPVMGVPR